MKKAIAEPYRDVNFAKARRGPVVTPEPGKTKISIRLDNTILEYFRRIADESGGGSYQTLINDALLSVMHQQSVLDAVRHVVREEMAPYHVAGASSDKRRSRPSKGKKAPACKHLT